MTATGPSSSGLRAGVGGATLGSLPAVSLYLLGLGLLLGVTLWLNRGAFAYSLDDAYIHLALAENVASGHYGINTTEVSSPSSSILWPLLLAPFSQYEWFSLVPLIFSTLCGALTVVTIVEAVNRRIGRSLARGSRAAMVFLIALAANLWGLPLTGMEHSAQLLVTAWVVVGVLELVETGRCSTRLLIGMVLGPYLRFENTSLLIMGAVVLVMHRHRLRAFVALGAAGAGIAAFVAFLASNGLPLLPSSVLVKSTVVGAPGLGPLLMEIVENLLESGAKFRVALVLVLMIVALRRRRGAGDDARSAQERVALLFLGGVLVAHMLVGRYDWQGRYEAYLLLTASLILFYLYRDQVRSLIERRRLPVVVIWLVVLLVAAMAQIDGTLRSPIYANSTYTVNYPLHRFAAAHWRDTVAVNDVGWVAFRNPYPVLDLWGLSSEEARLGRRDSAGLAWAEALRKERAADMLMIFEDWFDDVGELPVSWHKIAELEGRRRRLSGEPPRVSFFLADPERLEEARRALDGLADELPVGSSLDIL